MLIRSLPSGSPDVYDDGASVIAGATRLDFKDLNAENPSGTIATLYLNQPGIAGGRLTTETGVPVSTSDRTSQGTLYYTPFIHNKISLYDGTRWKAYTFTERSLSLTLTSGANYDVFLYDNAGTLTLELSAAWTNDTTRADALTTQDGVTVKSGATTRRWLGTIRASGTNVVEFSLDKRFVWNAVNRVRVPVKKSEHSNATTWTDTSNTWHVANSDAANQIAVVCGAAGLSLVDVTLHQTGRHGSAGIQMECGVGEDTAALPASPAIFAPTESPAVNVFAATSARLAKFVPLGYHTYIWLLNAGASGTVTWMGSATTANAESRCGLSGWYEA